MDSCLQCGIYNLYYYNAPWAISYTILIFFPNDSCLHSVSNVVVYIC